MGAEATTLHEGFEFTGPADDLAADIAALAPPKAEEPPKAEAKAEPAKEEPKAEPKPTAQETHDRIQRLTWEREEANRRAEAAEKRAADAAKPKAEAPKTEPSKADHARYRAMPDAPQIGDYEDVVDYATDMAVFASRKFLDEARATEHAARVKQTRETSARERHKGFSERLTAEKAADAEFDSVMANSSAMIDENGPMAYVITSSDIGPKIMKFLAQHPERAQAIFNIEQDMERYAQMRALETEVRLTLKAATAPPGSAQPDAATKVATKAEPPINPVGSSPVSVKDDDAPPGDDADDAEWFKWRASHNIDGSRKVARR